MGHSDKGEKNFKKEDRSTASDWRNLRRVSVLDETSASGVHISHCSGLTLLQVFVACLLPYQTVSPNFQGRNCQIDLSSVSGKLT